MASWRGSPELVGRVDEMATLADAVAAAAAGWRAVVLIGGEAGAGKTRLVTATAEHHAGTAAVLMGSSLGYADGGLPFAPVLGAGIGSQRSSTG